VACRLEGVPVVVGADRYRAGLLAWRRFRPDCLVLDDGFQHLRLARDLDLVLLDYRQPFGNGRLLPCGPLREPVDALGRADAVVLTRAPLTPTAGDAPAAKPVLRRFPHLPFFLASHEPYSYFIPRGSRREEPRFLRAVEAPASPPAGRRAFVFSGIARNEDFQRTAARMGYDVAGTLAFPDHHDYSARDVQALVSRCRAAAADLLITTEKDHARMDPHLSWPLDLVVVGVKVRLGRDEQAFDDFLEKRLAAWGLLKPA
jgi:tetraacyldisaccharide 4'-kinase